MNFKDILHKFRTESFTEREKGTKFERLMRSWLLTDPRYNELEKVWLWEDFPGRKDFGGTDTGIDLVAKTEMGDYWAIQCKCYAEDAVIDKPAVDSFLATSSRTFTNEVTFQTTRFAKRIWISTTNHWGSNAEEAIRHQDPPFSRVGLIDLNSSCVDWQKLMDGLTGTSALVEGKKPRKHQLNAISKAYTHYITENNNRGKLIMACGTGKTYTSLLINEQLLDGKGLVLFMVPSIALLGQSLNAWSADAKKPIKAVCICSDSKASRKIQNKYDDMDDSVVDLAVPASTNPKSIASQLKKYRNHDGLVVVFSTYQSIDAVSAAQEEILSETDGEYGVFDFIICDEAHRTTGVKLSDKDESNFTKIHSDDNVQGRKRLYMTATPRLYGESAKIKASEKDCILCSMDDKALYGEEFYRVNFSYAVQNGLLTDYKVLVLTIGEDDVPENIRRDVTDTTTELNFDDTSKLIGVINGLSKMIRGDDHRTWDADPHMMRRAVAFCSSIDRSASRVGIASKYVASVLPQISEKYDENLDAESLSHTVSITAKHIDGSMNSQERNGILQWLADEPDNDRECRVVTNVRCLSEGVDVPSLDAVLFLSARNSQVDVVQSVGRVMRTFHKGLPDEKKYGYIIIPIVVPSDVSAEEALDNSKTFDVVWEILNALRSHDDRFNAMVNKIALNKQKPNKQSYTPSVTIGRPGLGFQEGEEEARQMENAEIARQLELRFGELQDGMYAKLVEKCGDRLYWENWAKEIGLIAHKFIERISKLIQSGVHKKAFNEYLKGLQRNLNPSVDAAQAIEMLAQHIITRPVFDALFADYQFVNNNAVSRSMQRMIDLLQEQAFEKDTEVLEKFYQSVRTNVGGIDNLEGKQTIIKNLYEKFFKGAFPLTVEKLGIVYTPVECVDFIIHSVNDILKAEFNTSLTEHNVHILDPFVGTGTFITRLLQSGLIRPEDMERKYLNEIHCNEIVLLAYYIADVNIESVFHDITRRKTYLPYSGICLTDTFQLAEKKHNELFTEFFQDNSKRVKKQMATHVRVIVGNPPYSTGQKTAEDNAQNLSYPILDERIRSTYAAATAAMKRSLYDTYIKAFRWASDRIPENEGGIVAFISNGAWIDGNAQDGMRRCFEEEFTSIYVLNLRGNQRTSGELSRKEGGKIFGSGSRTPIAITFLVKNPAKKEQKAVIHYHDIGDYLTREQKLKMVRDFRSISSRKLDWQIVTPNEKADWINQRGGLFSSFIALQPEKKKDLKAQSFFSIYSSGVITNRESWAFNSSLRDLKSNIFNSLNFYNQERMRYADFIFSGPKTTPQSFVVSSPTKIKWDASLYSSIESNAELKVDDSCFVQSMYRPYFKQHLYFNKDYNWSRYLQPLLFPTSKYSNIVICVNGTGTNKDFSVLISNMIFDRQTLANNQCFPLYWYEENKNPQTSLFDDAETNRYIRRDGITDWILKEVRNRFGGSRAITKEHIFYYVYGLLHSNQYRERFADDLKKSLPRIPIVDNVQDFMDFYKAGKELADIHLNYEQGINVQTTGHDGDYEFFAEMPMLAHRFFGLKVIGDIDIWQNEWMDETYQYFVVDKMKFAKVRDENGKLVADKTRIIYNGHITIENIPLKAYEYIVNGKSAIDWIMERYAVTIDKASQIKNDPNDWSKEHEQPRYILDLLLSVIILSCKTVDVVSTLPFCKW
ncbi:DEAD/DEAH box helicase family protein [Phocaeicola massiliensis]|uniref:DEAD/DEAH box helicase n=1 Tax=Phocaeicola massiliensis TaxID=204516 RepID=UPI00234CC494|nr:type ISP restriction/modification enzyme [Phocaeicola massiliensis]MDC7186755.1 DEAD/DEAH box helicase family protein [Bacteroidaceae bacterium UO.H1004]MDC7199089.1 DEAD/DEAH box helicase family protein [Phocaeicola massiliensis]